MVVFPTGASVAASTVLTVPGSKYSQGSSVATDSTGFWVALEEWPNLSAAVGSIKVAHAAYNATTRAWSWNTPQTISPSFFTDMPSPLPGFRFRTNSFPAAAVVAGGPQVVWSAYTNGAGPGRVYRWSGGAATRVSDSGGDQFFPSIATDGSIAWSQVNAGTASSDQWRSSGGTAAKVSTASWFPASDTFFSGQFIGDYNEVVPGHPIWTDIRGPNPSYPGYEMDAIAGPSVRRVEKKAS